jgi:Flp pilus assembly protein TadG
MKTRLRHLRDDERGMSFILVGLGFTAFLAASILAIDVGMLMTARNQAQTSADAGALAGATALVFNNFTDHSPGGPAVTSAINTAQANFVMGGAPSVTSNDVTFPLDAATAAYDQVQVTVYRTQARSNPLATLIAGYFGSPTADISATATAMAAPANQLNCVLPFTIPDKWIETQCATETCPWSPTDTFDIAAPQGGHQNAGAPLAYPDQYVPPGQPGATGYNPATDTGLQLVLKPSNQSEVTPSMYNAWDIGGVTGASAYSSNIGGCNTTMTGLGNTMSPETGNMTGPTKQGVDALIAQDPNASWDPTCNGGMGCVKNSAFQVSPRIRAIPLYDPYVYAQDQHSGKSQPTLQIVNYLGFFIDSVDGSSAVTGYITPITGRYNPGGPVAIGGFARSIMLVR